MAERKGRHSIYPIGAAFRNGSYLLGCRGLAYSAHDMRDMKDTAESVTANTHLRTHSSTYRIVDAADRMNF